MKTVKLLGENRTMFWVRDDLSLNILAPEETLSASAFQDSLLTSSEIEKPKVAK